MIDDDIVFPLPPPDNKFYVYYNKDTGDITALTNGLLNRPGFDDYVEVPVELYEKLSDRKISLHQWIVSTTTSNNAESTIEVIPRNFKDFSFKNNSFDVVIEPPDVSTEVVVEWSKKTKHWVFSISQDFRITMAGKNFSTDKLSFFIVLENDFDFLIRTMYISLNDLSKNHVYIPFETSFENNIDNIAVVTKKVFNNYGLIKTYE